MKIIEGIRYSKDHEWVRREGNKATVGITDFAQHQLGEIVYVELPKIGAVMGAGDALAVVESVKSASDVYTPFAGIVTAANEALAESPEKLNEDPYGNWIAVLRVEDFDESELMDARQYAALCEEEE